MGEKSIVRIAKLLDRGIPVKKIRDVRGTAYMCRAGEKVNYPTAGGTDENGQPVGYDYDELKSDRKKYAAAFAVQYRNNDSINGKAIVEYYGDRMVVQNPPMPPLEREELDRVYELPYARTWHPMYDSAGGIPAFSEVRFSITHNRGCFGGCNFCAIAFHQGRAVRSRSIESCVKEARLIASLPDFKGYIHDVGGPSANFRANNCEKAKKFGVCKGKNCLTPKVCPNMRVDHSEYIELLKAIEAVPGVKKVFIRSGLRYDYILADKNNVFFRKLVSDHISGHLKVAPEHCCNNVLALMGKPPIEDYDRFKAEFARLTKAAGKEQYIVPYLMSSHPGSTLGSAVELAVYLKKNRLNPEQVQDFYPTPGTASTCMFYTGIDPETGREVYVARDYEEKRLQFARPQNAEIVRKALRLAGREELIGYSPECLVRPAQPPRGKGMQPGKGFRGKGNGNGGAQKQHKPERRKRK